jgi:hypothetical protein
MFCLGCGAELASRAEVCAICGRPAHPESPMSPRKVQRAAAIAATGPAPSLTPSMELAAIAIPAAQPQAAAPSVSSGDLAMFALPRDVTGRLVVALPFLMATDLLAPWIVFGEAHIAPSRLGLLAVVAAMPLALIAAMTVYLPFRQRPVLAAIPLVIASLALGGGALLLLMVGPFGARIVSVIGAGELAHLGEFIASGTPPSAVTPLTLLPDIGLYAFVAGAGALVVATYRRLDALITSHYRAPAQAETPVAPPIGPESDVIATQASAAVTTPGAGFSGARPEPKQTAHPVATLPGTPGWTQAPELPSIVRNTPSIRGLRRINPRG